MYKPLQKKSSSFPPTSIQKKSKNFSKPGSPVVQAKRDAKSPESPDMPSYSTAGADLLAENIMRGMEKKEQSEVETSTVQRQLSYGGVAVAAVAPPIVSIPVVQPNSVGIQRQCSECAEKQQQQLGEQGKDFDEMSGAASEIQAKLTVGTPGDVYEQEADRVAEQVIWMPVAAAAPPQVQRFGIEDSPVGMYSSLAHSITPVVHRRVDEQVQMYSAVQRAFQAGGTQASGDLESRLNASIGGGSALAPEVRAFMEPRFGADFSSVRVHTGSEAVQMNRELGAQAFAHGSDIYFGAGKSPGNNELTAHELTHVVQQNSTAVQRKPRVAKVKNQSELEGELGNWYEPPRANPALNGLNQIAENVQEKETDKKTIRRQVEVKGFSNPDAIQLSPLSDEVAGLWNPNNKGSFFDRLRNLTPQQRADQDLHQFVNTLGGDDCWLAQRILQYGSEPLWPASALQKRHQYATQNHWAHEPGHIAGVLDTTNQGRPITAYFFPGQTDERALIIAGVHGTERQGMEVAEMMMQDPRNSRVPPHFTVIVVPSLFPDSQAHGRFGRRESGVRAQDSQGHNEEVPTNRNFPANGQNLAQSTDAQGVARDADGRPILRENIALMSLMERFNPSRIITIHGTHRPYRAGIFVDPVQGQETQDRQLAIASAQQVVTNIQNAETNSSVTHGTAQRPVISSDGTSLERDIIERIERGELLERLTPEQLARFERAQAQGRRFRLTQAERRRFRLTQAEQDSLRQNAAVAGNQLFLGAGQENAGWSGETPGGISLGGYAPARGMTVFTVEPAINRRTSDYAAGNREGDRLSEAERRIEFQAYADAIRTVLLGN